MNSSKALLREWREHKRKVWSIANISEKLFASCGEDGSVKVWDLREERSVHTITDHVGKVTCMFSLDQNILLTGACPDKGFQRNLGAEIRVYDIRQSV